MLDRAALLELPPESLVELLLQLQATVARLEALVAEQAAQLSAQAARVQALEQELARRPPPPKTPLTSSLPPSQGFKPNRADRRRRKSGARRGHLGRSRRRQTPTVVVRCRPTRCGGCGAALAATGQRRVGRGQGSSHDPATLVIELPPVQPVVVEVWRYAAVCPGCQQRTVAAAPAGCEPHRTFGPGIEALLGYLHQRHHLSYERLVEVCRELFGLRISEGAIANALARLAERATPRYEALKAAVRGSPVLASDETSARVNGRTAWEWVFGTPTASVHLSEPTRSGRVIDDFLAGAVPEVWVSDLAAAQLGTAAGAHQICLAHQLRDLAYASEADDQTGRVWAVAMRRLFQRGIQLHRARASLTAEQFARRRVRSIKAAERQVSQRWPGTGEAAKLQRRYTRHWASLFVFLEREAVEPTNNASEQAPRNSVIHRKVTGGYRSDWGADASAILTSILATARKRGENLWAALRGLAGPSPLDTAVMPR
jgi:transposase